MVGARALGGVFLSLFLSGIALGEHGLGDEAAVREAAKKAAAVAVPELVVTLSSALRLKNHPVVTTVQNLANAQDPEGAKTRYQKGQSWARERMMSPIDAATMVAEAVPGKVFALMTPEALKIEAIEALFRTEPGAKGPTLVAIPLGNGIVLVSRSALR